MKIYKLSFTSKHIDSLKNQKYLFHATYKENLDSILKNGLKTTNTIKNWESSKNMIYLAESPYLAESFAETSERIDENEDLLDQIVILKIEISKLNINNLKQDSNIKQDEIDEMNEICFEYSDNIPPSAISIF